MIRRLLIAGLVLFMSPNFPAHADEGAPSHIAPGELLELIEAGKAPKIVDVRSRYEYDKGHVPGAIHIPFWAAFSRSSEMAAVQDDMVVVYCEHGPRAGIAKLALRFSGFKKIVYLEGHMTGWKKAGLPQQVTAVER